MHDPDTLSRQGDTLKALLLKWLPGQTRWETPIPGLAFTRYDEETAATGCFYNPMIALVVQGYKRSMIGDHEANYGRNHCVVVGVDMPGVFHVTEASPNRPFLSLSIKLNRRIISQLISEMPTIVSENADTLAPVVVSEAGGDLLDAFIRLVKLLDTPERIAILAPLILREIHFYLLNGNQGACLRLFNTHGTQASQIAQAVSWIQEQYASPLRMEELARQVNMAPSTFNRHFKKVTSLSPLQFQKRLRLYEAERLMLLEGKDAGTAAHMVGYESISQFTREYRRLFGSSPRKDMAQKRA